MITEEQLISWQKSGLAKPSRIIEALIAEVRRLSKENAELRQARETDCHILTSDREIRP